MARYKVLQDIEAEDKLLGPLTLRQFIYAAIVIVMGFIAFRLLMVQWFLAIPFLPPIIFFGLLAAPFGGSQSSEVWLLGKIRYWVFPKKRIWDQEGLVQNVTITVPKKVEKHLTKDFDKEEAKSRLKALASTMDTRGWAVKNVSTNMYANPLAGGDSSERLLSIEAVPQEDLAAVKPSEDVLDSTTNPLAGQIETMVAESDQQHKQDILQKMQQIRERQAAQAAAQPQPASAPSSPKVVQQPVAASVPQPTPTKPVATTAKPPVTQPQTTAILNNGNATQKPLSLEIQNDGNNDASDEVVISLH